MVENYDIRVYQGEFVELYEAKISKFMTTAVGSYEGERQVNGSTAQILVAGAGADSSARERTTRDGNLVYDMPERTPSIVTLRDIYSAKRHTQFDMFAGQADTRKIFMNSITNDVNRKIDDIIIGELTNASLTAGAAGQPVTSDMLLDIQAQLQDEDVPEDEPIFFALTPIAYNDLIKSIEVSSEDFVQYQPYADMPKVRMLQWNGCNIFQSTRLAGRGTNSATMFAWHRASIAACNNGAPTIEAGYNGEHRYYWYNAGIFIGAKILQNNGIRKITAKG